ncbi:hypothetical protein HVM88_004584 [Salmonella enterica subsp. enterica serovar Javiana]|nr:hypothetical protein [Salmonella enterica subsp. enterica serovar Javiana]
MKELKLEQLQNINGGVSLPGGDLLDSASRILNNTYNDVKSGFQRG